jgi:hypothetical protein
MKHLLIQSQTYQAAQFHIHLRMCIVMRQIDSLYTPVQELRKTKSTIKITGICITVVVSLVQTTVRGQAVQLTQESEPLRGKTHCIEDILKIITPS